MKITKKFFVLFATLTLVIPFLKTVAFDTSSDSSSPKKEIRAILEQEDFEIGKGLKHCVEQLEMINPKSNKDKEMIKYMNKKANDLMAPYIAHQPKENKKKAPKKSKYTEEGLLPFNLLED